MMMTSVREVSRFSACNVLGELVGETDTRYIYRRRHTSLTAFVDKHSPLIHIEPCQACLDYLTLPVPGRGGANTGPDALREGLLPLTPVGTLLPL